MKPNESLASKHLKKRGKYFAFPPKKFTGLKQLLRFGVENGIGKPYVSNVSQPTAWSVDELTDAISGLNHAESGVDRRTVHFWLAKNSRGISRGNLRLLARVFGCDDPEGTRLWLEALIDAREQLHLQRRSPSFNASNEFASEPLKSKRLSLAEVCNNFLGAEASLNLLVSHWVVFGALGWMNYALGTLSVTYSPTGFFDKQVGFIWAPTLTILPIIVLPLYILAVGNLISFWRAQGRPSTIATLGENYSAESVILWPQVLQRYNASFMILLAFAVFFVFGYQWGGIYVPVYLTGESGGVQIDRYLVTIYRPEVISPFASFFLSMFGYMYTASYIALFMVGQLFLIIISHDFFEVALTDQIKSDTQASEKTSFIALNLLWAAFRVAVLALWLAILLKLQIVYLASDGRDFWSWFANDFLLFIGASSQPNGWLESKTISHFTTFLMMGVIVLIFFFFLYKIRSVTNKLSSMSDTANIQTARFTDLTMGSTICLLAASLIMVGQVVGFSALIVASALVSFYAAIGPRLTWTRGFDDNAER